MRRVVLSAGLVLATAAAAQESSSFKLRESVLNSGGNPANGSYLASATYRIRLDAVGEGILGAQLASGSFHVDGGFVSAYPPPSEVEGVVFSDDATLAWSSERSVGSYNVYRDGIKQLPSLGYGACLQRDITATSASDPTVPATGGGFFYLVTAQNRIDEEGTKGFASAGTERGNAAPCP